MMNTKLFLVLLVHNIWPEEGRNPGPVEGYFLHYELGLAYFFGVLLRTWPLSESSINKCTWVRTTNKKWWMKREPRHHQIRVGQSACCCHDSNPTCTAGLRTAFRGSSTSSWSATQLLKSLLYILLTGITVLVKILQEGKLLGRWPLEKVWISEFTGKNFFWEEERIVIIFGFFSAKCTLRD